MTDPLSISLTVHLAILPFSLAGLYRFSGRSQLFTKSTADVDDLLSRLRRAAATDLERELHPVFERSSSAPSLVLPEDYYERHTNPVGSEVFRQAVRDFMENTTGKLVSYKQVTEAKRGLGKWYRRLSWSVYALVVWQIVICAMIGLLGGMFHFPLCDAYASWSFLPTAICVASFLLCLGGTLNQHDTIQTFKERYDGLP